MIYILFQVKVQAQDGLQGAASRSGTKNDRKEEKNCCKNVNINANA